MNKQVNLVRYCDDFIITGVSQEILDTEVKPLATDFLRERGLELSEEKTKITHIEDGFDFLGQHVRKYNGKFLNSSCWLDDSVLLLVKTALTFRRPTATMVMRGVPRREHYP